MILAIQPTTFSTIGGIQTYNALVCRVLNEMASNIESHVLFANDSEADIARVADGLSGLTLKAFEGRRTAFARHFLRLAFSRNVSMALIGHINYAPLGLLLKRLQPGMRYGVVLYGIEAWQHLPLLKRKALRSADFLISISEFTKQRAVETNGLNPDRVYLLPNALKSEGVAPALKPSSAGGGTTLLSVCRLESSEQYKGVDKVIEVLPHVVRKVPDVRYVVVGGGTDLERHKDLANRLGVADYVHFRGFLSEEDLQSQYRNCDVFVMPSAAEGFGFVFLEAMRYSKPVVAARSGGVPEVVQDKVTGRLVEYGAQDELANTLTELCLDPVEQTRLGEAGHERLRQNFSFPQFEQRLTEILLNEMASDAPCKVAISNRSAL